MTCSKTNQEFCDPKNSQTAKFKKKIHIGGLK